RGFPPEECRDLTQESFVRVFKGIASFRRQSPFGRWLFEIVANVYRNEIRWRRAGKRDVYEESLEATGASGSSADGADPVVPADPGPSPLEDLLLDQERRRLRAAIGRLPPQMQTCCRLRFEQGLKYEEVAQVMKLSIETVKAHLHQAKRRLLQELG